MLFSAGKLIANEFDERKRESNEGGSVLSHTWCKLHAQKNRHIFSARICASDIRCFSAIILAILGCIRIMLKMCTFVKDSFVKAIRKRNDIRLKRW